MKLLKHIGFFLILFSFVGITACKKPGLGGDATIIAHPKHHGEIIYGATAYLKFNTSDFPGSSVSAYDEVFTSNSSDDHINLKGLNPGTYYVYIVGYDDSNSESVYGGQSFTIKRKDRKDTKDLEIPVTE